MQTFGFKNLPASPLSQEQINAMRFNLLNLKPTVQKPQALPTQNAISNMFNNGRVQNGFQI